MGPIARSGTWDEASSPAATRLARRFEDAWRDPRRSRRNGNEKSDRPEPADFLPEGDRLAPAAWLAILRAELNLRWDDGESVRVEEYRNRYPGLDAETLVALCYEEFCRREEDGASPFPSEYDERFPDLAERLRRVFDIHDLVGNAGSTDLHVPGPEVSPFPEARQTIAGFHLVEELGRGSFARVFLARERQLADRPVALKVARAGSREPQTLARLQHTHIVPVHSYRTDPATGLHLLCMPYFGRVTLARLLAEPSAKVAPTGAELLATLDRLDQDEANSKGSSARSTLAKLPFPRAIAWWGARLAEALAHAHDRGVLHRDIKPSNVLVTGDGLPMLLDFNLAGEFWADRGTFEPDHLGGTLAYMAPEHIEAVARGEDDRLDARADVYSLGVLLFEALAGDRPFPKPTGSSMPEALRRAAEDRRGSPPRLLIEHPEIPAALERVVRRCLEPDPADRFPTAADLALDLQAVVDDAPLRSTREPLAVRLARRARRSWRRLLLVGLLAGSAVALATSAIREGDERVRLASTAKVLLDEGRQFLNSDDFARALARFDEVGRLTEGRPELLEIRLKARVQQARARDSGRSRARVDQLLRVAPTLRVRMIAHADRPADLERDLAALFAPFRVFEDVRWASSPELIPLDPARKARLLREVEELLFLFASGFDPGEPAASRRGVELCDRALGFSPDPRPWKALRDRLDDSPAGPIADDPGAESSPTACLEWAALRDRQGRPKLAGAWLGRAVELEPGHPWNQFHRATLLVRLGDVNAALRHFEAAVALEPDSQTFREARTSALKQEN